MKIFKELKKLGYIHYSATTIEELDDLPLNSAERISEQALVLRWFREKYQLHYYIIMFSSGMIEYEIINLKNSHKTHSSEYKTYEEAELECLVKLIDIVKKQNLKG